jgi:CIC family chloride channel protein
MGGFFAGVAKVPIAALIMVAEMTGGYALIVPMMIVSSLSYLLLGRVSLYEKQVATRVDSPAHLGDFAVDVMDHLTVRDAVGPGRRFDAIPDYMPFEEILRLMLSSSQQDFPVVDNEGRLGGIISMTDLRQAMADSAVHSLLVAKDVAITGVMTVTMHDSLNTALKLMAELDVRELPVVSEERPGTVMAMVSRKEITQRYHGEIEHLRKHRGDKKEG